MVVTDIGSSCLVDFMCFLCCSGSSSNNNTFEVHVDVHQTIQCPEVSTSSMESDAEV